MRRFTFALLLLPLPAFAEPIKVCVAQPNGSEAKNWKLQAPLAKRLEQDAGAKQIELSAMLLDSDSEKRAKSEAAEKACGYVLLTTIDSAKDQVFGTFNPDPRARSQGDINHSMNATSVAINVNYKLLRADGKKLASNTVPMSLKEGGTAADFEEAGHRLIADLAARVLGVVIPRK